MIIFFTGDNARNYFLETKIPCDPIIMDTEDYIRDEAQVSGHIDQQFDASAHKDFFDSAIALIQHLYPLKDGETVTETKCLCFESDYERIPGKAPVVVRITDLTTLYVAFNEMTVTGGGIVAAEQTLVTAKPDLVNSTLLDIFQKLAEAVADNVGAELFQLILGGSFSLEDIVREVRKVVKDEIEADTLTRVNASYKNILKQMAIAYPERKKVDPPKALLRFLDDVIRDALSQHSLLCEEKYAVKGFELCLLFCYMLIGLHEEAAKVDPDVDDFKESKYWKTLLGYVYTMKQEVKTNYIEVLESRKKCLSYHDEKSTDPFPNTKIRGVYHDDYTGTYYYTDWVVFSTYAAFDRMVLELYEKTVCPTIDAQLREVLHVDEFISCMNDMIGADEPEYIVDVCIASRHDRTNAKNARPYGYTLIERDLNSGAGGNFIYLCYKMRPLSSGSTAITNMLIADYNDGMKEDEAVPYTHDGKQTKYHRLPDDLNKDARGKFRYLAVTKDAAFGPIQGLTVVFDEEPAPAGWKDVCWLNTTTKADINKGIGGKYIYIHYLR